VKELNANPDALDAFLLRFQILVVPHP